MLYLFHGSDSARVRAKAFQWVAAARAKANDAAYVRLDAKDIAKESIAEVVASQGLFFSKTLVLLDDPFSESASGELVLAALPILAASENAIAILAPGLLAARVKKIEAHAGKVFSIDAPKKVARGFNSALVDALGAKDTALLWKEIQKALRAGDAPEMIHGLLHWKARDMMQKGSRVWGKDGARTLSRNLILLLSDARGGSLPLALSLERFALSLSGK